MFWGLFSRVFLESKRIFKERKEKKMNELKLNKIVKVKKSIGKEMNENFFLENRPKDAEFGCFNFSIK